MKPSEQVVGWKVRTTEFELHLELGAYYYSELSVKKSRLFFLARLVDHDFLFQ